MDTSAPKIVFDDNGICNFCVNHEIKVRQTPNFAKNGEPKLDLIFEKIRHQKGKDYDCLIGLSGGVDSSYVAYQAVKSGLRPLAVHFDNGWNSELAVKNIENIVTTLGIDLYTFVIDWPEFRDIQRSYFKAHVIDIEMVTDHAIFAAMYKIANKFEINYILSGTNAATESIMPQEWHHFKFDIANLKDIHCRFGTIPIKNYPTISPAKIATYHYLGKIKTVSPLNFIEYSKTNAMETLKSELSWQYYGGKHYESVFTKFYQSFILPQKFGVDKRKPHLSDLIMNGEISRDEALAELQKPLYKNNDLEIDADYVCKKLGFTRDEFASYIKEPAVSHFAFRSNAKFANQLIKLHKRVRHI